MEKCYSNFGQIDLERENYMKGAINGSPEEMFDYIKLLENDKRNGAENEKVIEVWSVVYNRLYSEM